MNEFAILGISKAPLTNGVHIIALTNTPCHLTCYWTDKPPLRHKNSRTLRGLTIPWGAYFCFVGWNTLEQAEAGDTLTHTFDLTPWEICQTRYFLFKGTVGGIAAPSISPIFSFHRYYLAFPQQFEFWDGAWDQRVSIYGNAWQGQTFTPQERHILTGLYLFASRSIYTWPTLFIDIKEAPDDTPTGSVLSSGSISATQLTPNVAGDWEYIPLTSYTLNLGTKYAIIAHSNASSAARLFAYANLFAGTYPRGIYISSPFGGASWFKWNDGDLRFSEQGTPFYP